MTATPAQLQVIRLTAELVAPGYASLRHIEELRARLRTALIAMDVEAELAELSTQSCPVVSTAESRLDGGEAA